MMDYTPDIRNGFRASRLYKVFEIHLVKHALDIREPDLK